MRIASTVAPAVECDVAGYLFGFEDAPPGWDPLLYARHVLTRRDNVCEIQDQAIVMDLGFEASEIVAGRLDFIPGERTIHEAKINARRAEHERELRPDPVLDRVGMFRSQPLDQREAYVDIPHAEDNTSRSAIRAGMRSLSSNSLWRALDE